MISKIARLFDRINDIFAVLAAAIILFVMLAVGTEVVMRSFFGHVTKWVLEYSEYSLLFVTFLGATWVLKRGRHVRMDIIVRLFSKKTQSLFNFITYLLCAFVCMLITWYGASVTWDYYKAGYYFSTPLETPKFIILGIIPLGGFLLSIQFLRTAYSYLNEWKSF